MQNEIFFYFLALPQVQKVLDIDESVFEEKWESKKKENISKGSITEP